ncbi:BMP family ABC transporter substrate-binding protein [Kiloniella sp. b19]|uniref:BMP family ABC transporter substrate-binding protein n=1 Tax=Kiloniella sp. GXU_MW_B19 TaxID=3141326 RepID=UPI0031DBF2B9
MKKLVMMAAAAVLAGMSAVQAADPLKVGFVYVGPVGDHGWSYQHDQGRRAIIEKFGDKVDTTFVESVPEGADAERVIANLAQSGHDLIFTTSFGFMNPTLKVAKRFPQVKFEHATGFRRAPNVSTYAARFYEGRTVSGIIAGHMTESGKIGYIGSFPIPEVVRGINAATLAARSVRPDAEVKVIWVNSWFDPGKEADAAKALIDQGVDVILQHTDSPAPVQAAESRGVWAVGQASDMARFGEKAHLTAIIDDWSEYYIARTEAVLNGEWKSEDTWGGYTTGMVKLADFNAAIPAEVVEQAKQAKADIESGKRHSFQGPIRNQAGEEVVAEGEVISDEKLLSMDWYVEGVQGSLPKN